MHHAALMPHTRATLRALQEKFDHDLLAASTEEERYANREALKQQVQSLVAREGQVYLPSLPLAVQDLLGSVPLRAKLEQTLKPLAFHGVPLTIFCAGYGDVAAQVLALSTPGMFGEGEKEGKSEGAGTDTTCCVRCIVVCHHAYLCPFPTHKKHTIYLFSTFSFPSPCLSCVL